MRDLGVPTSLHLVVPDEADRIERALQYCAQNCDTLFVTGGLGPTSDDFTRDVVAHWAGRKLIWDEASWQHLKDRLQARHYAVRDIQRQQCYFPEGSEVLTNRMGTANAFYLSHQSKDIYVLPGPPGEIAAVWQDHLDSRLREKTRSVDALITRSWDTIGCGESEIADRVEEVLKGCPFEKGYRVHLPYVEFKITYLKSQGSQAEPWLRAIETCLAPMTVLRDGEDAAEKLASALQAFEQVIICDEIPGSFLLHRLFPFCKNLLRERKLSFVTSWNKLQKDQSSRTLLLHLREESSGSARATVEIHRQKHSQQMLSPFTSLLLKDRERQFYAEMAMVSWLNSRSQW